jgi:catechol 2,3-dioxygenase-like lactoylglutathione lyase family enzyme
MKGVITMSSAMLEHVNITVSDPVQTASALCELFDWQVRWQGPSKMGGHTVHVGTSDAYVAVYSYDETSPGVSSSYAVTGGLNHIGVVVTDLDATEQRVLQAGYKTHNHGDYEPGRRFYFNDRDGIEFEVVAYD